MPNTLPVSEHLQRLREDVATAHASQPGLPFGIGEVDDRLAYRGITAALHDVAPASAALSDDAAATLFTAGTAARAAGACGRRVLWVVSRFDLYAPGLEQAGLSPDRLIFVEARDDKQVLAAMEDGLRDGALAAVVGEVRRADMTASRRLQLAAGEGRTPTFLFRRWRRAGVCPLTELSAATTRWRIGCAPSERQPAPGVGRPRWTVELVRQRNGNPFSLFLEACDETGCLALPAGSRDRAIAAAGAATLAA